MSRRADIRRIFALLSDLNLHLGKPGKLMPEGNRRVLAWIKDHLRVAIVAMEDRVSLVCIERAISHRPSAAPCRVAHSDRGENGVEAPNSVRGPATPTHRTGSFAAQVCVNSTGLGREPHDDR